MAKPKYIAFTYEEITLLIEAVAGRIQFLRKFQLPDQTHYTEPFDKVLTKLYDMRSELMRQD